MSSTVEYTINPPGRLPSVNWPELWRYRDLFLVLAWRDISVRYKQTLLGVLWALLQPVVTMVIFTFIFNRMAGLQSGDGTPYPIFLYTGLLFWQYYSSTLTNVSNSMVANAAMIQKVYFPRLVLPAACATTGLVDMALSGVVLIGMMLYYHYVPRMLGLAVAPVLLFCTVATALGLGLIMASLNVKYRDVRYALPFFIQLLMYVTPVIYPVKLLDAYPVAKALMLWLNPMSGVITVARAAALGASPVEPHLLGISLASSLILLTLGIAYFRGTERYFADVV